jgi:hypothetical protein
MVTLLELRRLLIEAADQGPLIEQLARTYLKIAGYCRSAIKIE